MQVDGYRGYQCVFALGNAIKVGCMMHARRYFVRAFEGRDIRAAEPLELIRKMYRVEAASKEAGEWPHERLLRRQRETRLLFDAWRQWQPRARQRRRRARPAWPGHGSPKLDVCRLR
jgi:transposase